MTNKSQINKYANKHSFSSNKDIHERIYQFIGRVLDLIKALPPTLENKTFGEQLVRAVTSMGANDQEADCAESKKDFLAKYGIVKKENKETNFWLRLIYDRNPILRKRMSDLIREGQEILLIVSKIISNTRRRI